MRTGIILFSNLATIIHVSNNTKKAIKGPFGLPIIVQFSIGDIIKSLIK
jgi:hypothetical protein